MDIDSFGKLDKSELNDICNNHGQGLIHAIWDSIFEYWEPTTDSNLSSGG